MENKIKKHITSKWLDAFPNLKAYAQNKLYKIVGGFIIGLELINIPRSENYRPHFVIYPLFKVGLKACFEYPILMFEFYNSKNLQLNLPYNDTNEIYKVAQNIISEKLTINFNKDVSLRDLFKLIDACSFNDSTYKSHSGKLASLYELKFYATLYCGNQDQIQSLLDKILNESRAWDMKMFEIWYGKFDLWLKVLEEKISNRESFLKQIEMNKQDEKMKILNFSNLFHE